MRWTVTTPTDLEDVGADFASVQGGALVFEERVNLITRAPTEWERRVGIGPVYQRDQRVATVIYAPGQWSVAVLDDRDGIHADGGG